MVSEEQNSKMELASEVIPVPRVQPELEAPGVDDCDVIKGIPRKKIRHRHRALYAAILQQMEFYFGDANLAKDRFIAGLIKDDPDVPLETFLRFNKIRSITTDVKVIAKALQNSEMLKVSEDGTKVRRVTPIIEKQNIDECTVYVQRLPLDADHDWLTKLFSKYGKVAYVSIPKFKFTHKIKGFAFIEFEKPEEAEKCLKDFRAKGCELPSQTAPTEMMSITTFHQEEKQEQKAGDSSFESDKSKNKKKKKKKTRHSDLENSEVQDNAVKTKKEESEKDFDACTSDSNAEVEEKKLKRKMKDETDQADFIKPKKKKDKDSDLCGSDSNTEVVEKKRKKIKVDTEDSESEQVDLQEPKKKKIIKDSDVCNSDSNNESEEKMLKKQKKRKSLETLNSDLKPQETVEEKKRKHKKSEIEKLEETDESNKDEINKTENSEDAKDGSNEENVPEKKKKRKRNRTNTHAIEEAPLIGMQVMGKKEWKRLRNRYLDLQRTKMKQLKQHLKKAQWNQWGEKNKIEDEGQEVSNQKQDNPASKLEFSPGLIVKIELNEPCIDTKHFKAELRSSCSSVKYVDIKEGSSTAFVRCDTPESANSLTLKSSDDLRYSVLNGKEETNYWDKIKQDREVKIGSNMRTKQKGRKKLLKKAEKELGKHIKFED